jgi:hypothetical protein
LDSRGNLINVLASGTGSTDKTKLDLIVVKDDAFRYRDHDGTLPDNGWMHKKNSDFCV